MRTLRTKAVEHREGDLGIKDRLAYALKGEQVGSLAFELFDSGAARFGDRVERREGQASQTVRRQADGQQRCGCCGSGWNNIEMRAFW